MLMEIFMQENGRMTKPQVMENILTLMVLCMRVSG